MNKDDLDKKIRQILQTGEKLNLVEGIFNGRAYIRELPTTEEGKLFEVLGCSYKWKFITSPQFIDSIAITKRVYASTLRLLSKYPYLTIFLRRRDIIDWLVRIYRADLANKIPQDTELPYPHREILRVGKELLSGQELELLICVIAFLYDSAYCFRLQDVFGEFSKENIRKDLIKELLRVSDIVIQREIDDGVESVKRKIKKVQFLLRLLVFKPSVKRFLKEFLLALDFEKMKLSEADWYFCLDRIDYNHKGLTHEEKMKIKVEIDREKQHCILDI